MSEFEQLYREVILDHYKTPRNHGLLDPNDAVAEGQNPLCGDEVTVSVRFGAGRRDRERRLRGARLRDQPGGDVDADGPREGPNGAGRGGDAEGRAARRDRDPADAGAPQVRAARARRAQGRAQQGEGHAAARRSGARRAARSPSGSRWPRSTSARSRSCRRAPCGSSRSRRSSRSGSTTATASCSRSRIGAPTTTGRCARATSTVSSGSPSARATAPASTSQTGRALTLPAYISGRDVPGARARRRHGRRRRLSRAVTVRARSGLPSSTRLGIHSGLPRKGGGPDVTDSSSTGSGGTSG